MTEPKVRENGSSFMQGTALFIIKWFEFYARTALFIIMTDEMQVVLGLIVICDYTNVSYISFSFINLLQPPHAPILHPIVYWL